MTSGVVSASDGNASYRGKLAFPLSAETTPEVFIDSVRSVRLAQIAFLMIVALLFAAPAHALEGRVVDRRTGKPVAGAEVGIGGLAGTVRTAQDGRFVWTPDPPLPFTVIVILPGGRLAKPVRIATLAGTEPLLIPIDPAFEESIVISGSAPSVEAMPGAATTLVPSADIGRRAPANLMQALENVPGVGGVAEGQSAVPAIRGCGAPRRELPMASATA